MTADTEVIGSGSRVTMHFSLRLKDGTIADTSHGEAPLSLVIGQGDMIEGLERRLLGLRPGDRRHFEITAAEAYGPASDEAIQHLPRADFPPEMELEPGLVVGFETPSGDEVPGIIIAVTEMEVAVDFSHPLAGHDLVFDVEILAVDPA